MTEIQNIAQLFEALQQGDCWIGLNIQQVLAGTDARAAAYKLNENGNTIWQLVNHISYWRQSVMIRLSGKDAYPAIPDFYIPSLPDENLWKKTVEDFMDVYDTFSKALLAFDESKLHHPSPKKGQTYYQLLMGCLQHDAYHMGQMVLLKKIS